MLISPEQIGETEGAKIQAEQYPLDLFVHNIKRLMKNGLEFVVFP